MASSAKRVRRSSQPDVQIARMSAKHAELKKQLDALNKRLYLSPEAELERRKLQKQKLLYKDKIRALQ